MSDELKKTAIAMSLLHPGSAKEFIEASLPITPVKIDERLIHRIGVREWGLPSLVMPGKIWRSKVHGTISCMLPKDDTHVRIETLPLIIVDSWQTSWVPDTWREALWGYVQAWPSSGCGFGPLLAITEEQRCDFLRRLGKQLADSDNIGCRAIAHDIGQFAAYDYALPEAGERQTER